MKPQHDIEQKPHAPRAILHVGRGRHDRLNQRIVNESAAEHRGRFRIL
jgi:hypothetical protein